MAFSDFRSYDEVIERFNLGFHRRDFIPAGPPPRLDDRFREQMEIVWREFPYQRSEGATSNALIFPILFEVWKDYREHLLLLSQETLRYDAELCGVVDFVLCKRSSRSEAEPDRPFLLVGEAKQDEIFRGWGQALSAMVAVNRRDRELARTTFGIATNGRYWEFGKLEGDTFLLDTQPFSPRHLDHLVGALHYVFAACREQVLHPPAPTAAA